MKTEQRKLFTKANLDSEDFIELAKILIDTEGNVKVSYRALERMRRA